jgi:hypothetical protein
MEVKSAELSANLEGAGARFRRDGWAAVGGLLDAPLLDAAQAASATTLMEGRDGTAGFPFDSHADALNELSLCPALLTAAGRLLRTADTGIRLVESALLAAAEGPPAEPATLLHYHLAAPPGPAAAPEAVVATVYLTSGSAAFQPAGSAGPERVVDCAPGAVLFSRLEAAWRPTAALTQRLVFRTAAAEWVSADDFIRANASRLARTPPQLCALGWPPPGHPYWDAASLAEAARRYPEHDLAPFGAGVAPQAAVATPPPPLLVSAPPPADEHGTHWQPPERAAGVGGAVLSEVQCRRYREEGCLLLDGVWPDALVAAAQAAAHAIHPLDKGSGRSHVEEEARLLRVPARGVTQQQERNCVTSFPYDSPALNSLVLHPRILGAVAQVLATPASELRICHSSLNGKYGPDAPRPAGFRHGARAWGDVDGDQPLHLDFGNNTMLTPARSPTRWAAPDEVQCIIYHDDWRTGGPTAFVPGLRNPGAKEDQARLYASERCAQYRPGTVLMYQLGCWHRGTPVNFGRVRRKQHLSFRTATATWIGGAVGVGAPTAKSLHALGAAGLGFDTGAFLGALSADQRAVIGFPALASPYWRRETLEGVRRRYAGRVDVRPYARAAGLDVPRL